MCLHADKLCLFHENLTITLFMHDTCAVILQDQQVLRSAVLGQAAAAAASTALLPASPPAKSSAAAPSTAKTGATVSNPPAAGGPLSPPAATTATAAPSGKAAGVTVLTSPKNGTAAASQAPKTVPSAAPGTGRHSCDTDNTSETSEGQDDDVELLFDKDSACRRYSGRILGTLLLLATVGLVMAGLLLQLVLAEHGGRAPHYQKVYPWLYFFAAFPPLAFAWRWLSFTLYNVSRKGTPVSVLVQHKAGHTLPLTSTYPMHAYLG